MLHHDTDTMETLPSVTCVWSTCRNMPKYFGRWQSYDITCSVHVHKRVPAIHINSFFVFSFVWSVCMRADSMKKDRVCVALSVFHYTEWYTQSVCYLSWSRAHTFSSWGGWMRLLWWLHSNKALVLLGTLFEGWGLSICATHVKTCICWGSVAALTVGMTGAAGGRVWKGFISLPYD